MNAFLNQFAATTGLSDNDAREQWAGYSRMLSDRQIKNIERGGAKSGERMGRQFLADYPNNDKDNE
jgi:hypothetical protein